MTPVPSGAVRSDRPRQGERSDPDGLIASRAHRAARRAPWFTAGAVVLAWSADLLFDPTSRHVPLCPFHVATGWWCPLCGGLRAAYELAHGHLAAAWRDNLLFVAALPLIALYFLDWVVRARRGEGRRRLPGPVFALVLALGVVFWVVRNLPGMEPLRPL